TGYDKMYLIEQNNSENYIVNSEHTLVLYYAGQGTITCFNSNIFKFNWYDVDDNKFKTKNFNDLESAQLFKLEMENKSFNFSKTINISVKKYLELSESRKSCFKGI